MTSKLSLLRRGPKLDQSLKLSASTAKEMVTGSGNALNKLVDKKDGKVNKGIFDIQVIDVYLTSVYSSPWVFDTCSFLLRLVTRNRGYIINRD